MQEHDINLLLEELEQYRTEKEKIRKIIGSIGGRLSGKKEKFFNWGIIIAMVVLFLMDVGKHVFHLKIPLPSIFSLEIAILLVSIKIISMMHMLSKIAHFQFWILNAIEFRLNTVHTTVRKLEKMQ